MVLNLSKVTKTFDKNIVLREVNLLIDEGECRCLIGRNGSGKSTLINMIIDVLRPDSGKITFWGKEINEPTSNIKTRIGVLPEFNPVIEEFTLNDYLEYVGIIYKVDKKLIKQRIDYLVNYFFDDTPSKKKAMSSFSKGMKLKAGICAALIHKPKLLILDEPFDGMDVFSANNLVTFLNEYVEDGNSILISSHDMLFVEKVATHISLIKGAEILNFSVSDFCKNDHSFEENISSILGYNPKVLKPFK